MAKFLVTGGAGFIGSNLVDALIASGDKVRVLDDLSSGRIENLDGCRSRIEFVEASVTDRAAVGRAVDGVDFVLHHAALASVPRSIEDPWLNHAINVDGTLTVLMAAHRAGVKRLVLASSAAVYGESEESPKVEGMDPAPVSPYATSKLIGEWYCRQFTASGWLPTVSLRYFNIFGPRQDPASDYAAAVPIFIQRLLDGTPVTIYGDGEQTRDFTYVENVVRANLLAVAKDEAVGGVFNIGCGECYRVLDLFRHVARAIGSDLEPVFAPPRLGDVRASQASIDRAREVLGYEPEVGFEGGLGRTCAWFRDHRSVVGGSAER